MTAAAAAATTIPSSSSLDAALSETPKNIPTNPLAMVFQPPEGFTYNWKRVFITQNDPDMANLIEMVAAGWRPVPRTRHAELLLRSMNSDFSAYWIEHGGLVLMEKRAEDCEKPWAHPTPFAKAMTPTGEFEYVHKIVIRE